MGSISFGVGVKTAGEQLSSGKPAISKLKVFASLLRTPFRKISWKGPKRVATGDTVASEDSAYSDLTARPVPSSPGPAECSFEHNEKGDPDHDSQTLISTLDGLQSSSVESFTDSPFIDEISGYCAGDLDSSQTVFASSNVLGGHGNGKAEETALERSSTSLVEPHTENLTSVIETEAVNTVRSVRSTSLGTSTAPISSQFSIADSSRIPDESSYLLKALELDGHNPFSRQDSNQQSHGTAQIPIIALQSPPEAIPGSNPEEYSYFQNEFPMGPATAALAPNPWGENRSSNLYFDTALSLVSHQPHQGQWLQMTSSASLGPSNALYLSYGEHPEALQDPKANSRKFHGLFGARQLVSRSLEAPGQHEGLGETRGEADSLEPAIAPCFGLQPSLCTRPARNSDSHNRTESSKWLQIPPPRPRSASAPNGHLVCDHCERVFDRSSDLAKHSKNVHVKPVPCRVPGCDCHFGEKSVMERHVSSVHREYSRRTKYFCENPNCKYAEGAGFHGFARLDQQKRHMMTKHGTSPAPSSTSSQSQDRWSPLKLN